MDLRTRLTRIYGKPNRSTELRNRLEKLAAGPPHFVNPRSGTDTDFQTLLSLADFLGGRWKERSSGRVLTVEREFSGHHVHGQIPLKALYRTTSEPVCQLAGDRAFVHFHPETTLFIDTETTGLAGGAGTYVFLVGIGYFQQEKFRTHQLFLADFQSERALLEELTDILQAETQGSGFRYLVSFNGRSYDLNLLNNRFILQRLEPPFKRFAHLDLLYPCRLLWRSCFENCCLQTLEQKILGVHRQGDIPSALIPRTYFDYVHSGYYGPLLEVFEHNRLDLLSMITLVSRISDLIGEPDEEFRVDPLAAARLHIRYGNYERATALLTVSSRQEKWKAKRADLLFQLARVKKKLGAVEEALTLCLEVIHDYAHPPVEAFVEAAKILEHRKKDPEAALQITRRALKLHPDSPLLQHRFFRLQCRIAGKRWY
jgi:uncharacterized protein